MENRRLTHAPAAHACMVVRRPAAEAFRAFADPAATSRFWYGKSRGPVVAGAELRSLCAVKALLEHGIELPVEERDAHGTDAAAAPDAGP
ncbi:hypothetical protein [Streptomyces sp. NBC_00158]|uniref:hypothetical protein n=1 Tax=Streptomyces sp. NBC_00158 TaxID=2903627 RepID=UPI002F915395